VCLWPQAQQLQAAEAQLQATVKELQEGLAAAETELTESKAAAAEQATRLAHLEGEFEALQVRPTGACLQMFVFTCILLHWVCTHVSCIALGLRTVAGLDALCRSAW
jgi:hypothetical protein